MDKRIEQLSQSATRLAKAKTLLQQTGDRTCHWFIRKETTILLRRAWGTLGTAIREWLNARLPG